MHLQEACLLFASAIMKKLALRTSKRKSACTSNNFTFACPLLGNFSSYAAKWVCTDFLFFSVCEPIFISIVYFCSSEVAMWSAVAMWMVAA